jgi:hypothetical protein
MSPNAFAAIADALETDWRSIARAEQLPPPGDWSTWLYLGGRGAGKTRSGAELGAEPRRGRQRGPYSFGRAHGGGRAGRHRGRRVWPSLH